MRAPHRGTAILAACCLALAACSASHAATTSPARSATTAATADASKPTASALMICAAETRGNIATALGIKATLRTSTSWVDHLYTCTYHLPIGTFVLSVKELANPAAAHAYLDASRQRLAATTSLGGPSDTAWASATGTVLLLKASAVLLVDATALPAVLGPEHQQRNDFAALIAADILACWNGS